MNRIIYSTSIVLILVLSIFACKSKQGRRTHSTQPSSHDPSPPSNTTEQPRTLAELAAEIQIRQYCDNVDPSLCPVLSPSTHGSNQYSKVRSNLYLPASVIDKEKVIPVTWMVEKESVIARPSDKGNGFYLAEVSLKSVVQSTNLTPTLTDPDSGLTYAQRVFSIETGAVADEALLKKNQEAVAAAFMDLDVTLSHDQLKGRFDRKDGHVYDGMVKKDAIIYGEFYPLEMTVEKDSSGSFSTWASVEFPDVYLPIALDDDVQVTWKVLQTQTSSELKEEKAENRQKLTLMKMLPGGSWIQSTIGQRQVGVVDVEATLTKGQGAELFEVKKLFRFKMEFHVQTADEKKNRDLCNQIANLIKPLNYVSGDRNQGDLFLPSHLLHPRSNEIDQGLYKDNWEVWDYVRINWETSDETVIGLVSENPTEWPKSVVKDVTLSSPHSAGKITKKAMLFRDTVERDVTLTASFTCFVHGRSYDEPESDAVIMDRLFSFKVPVSSNPTTLLRTQHAKDLAAVRDSLQLIYGDGSKVSDLKAIEQDLALPTRLKVKKDAGTGDEYTLEAHVDWKGDDRYTSQAKISLNSTGGYAPQLTGGAVLSYGENQDLFKYKTLHLTATLTFNPGSDDKTKVTYTKTFELEFKSK